MDFRYRLSQFAESNQRSIILTAVLCTLLYLGWSSGALSPVYPNGVALLIIGMGTATYIIVNIAVQVAIVIGLWRLAKYLWRRRTKAAPPADRADPYNPPSAAENSL